MPRRFSVLIVALVVMLMAGGAAQFSGVGPAAAQQVNCRTFTETGKSVCGLYLSYWDEHGGLAQQGYPLTGEFQEASDVDGNTYAVQYFERSVFEMHSRDQAPKNYVLLSLLGDLRYNQKYPNGAPGQKANTTPGSVSFPQTGKRLGGAFLGYWKAHGGLAQQGYPISNEFAERSDLDGNTYTVQYFERAVFELHPENRPPNNVLLSQLGAFRLKSKYTNTLPAGVWGGDHIALFATNSGATLEFDCAHGSINQPVVPDAGGRFDATGVFVLEHGGPVYGGEPEDSHPARFTGVTDGSTMTLTITLTDTNTTQGTYVLFRGKVAKLMKCL
jgi:hypothetical protein